MLKPYLTVLVACLSLAACSTSKLPAAPKMPIRNSFVSPCRRWRRCRPDRPSD